MPQHLKASLWQTTAKKLAPNPKLESNIQTDVVIVGAGFTGLRAAIELTENNTQVVVLDAVDVGYGASGRNGGQVNPMLPFNSPEQIQKIIGNQFFENLTEASLNSADSLFEFISKHKIDCQARQKGWLRVSHCEKAHKVALKNAQDWNKFGADMIPLNQKDVQKLSGSNHYQAGIVTLKGGAIQPLSLVRGESSVALNAGVKIFANSPVTKIKRINNKWEAHTRTGKVTADSVILATNGYTDSLLPNLSKSVLPLVSIQIATDPLNEKQISSILPKGHTISDTRRSIMYARREPDNRIVFGGHGKLVSTDNFSGFNAIIKDVEHIFPQLKGTQWRYRWGGKIAITQDKLPHFHEPKPGLIAGLGYNGRGVAMSHIMGKCLADRILGTPLNQLPFPSSAIKNIPFWGIQMMATGPVISFMKLLDKLESKTTS